MTTPLTNSAIYRGCVQKARRMSGIPPCRLTGSVSLLLNVWATRTCVLCAGGIRHLPQGHEHRQVPGESASPALLTISWPSMKPLLLEEEKKALFVRVLQTLLHTEYTQHRHSRSCLQWPKGLRENVSGVSLWARRLVLSSSVSLRQDRGFCSNGGVPLSFGQPPFLKP